MYIAYIHVGPFRRCRKKKERIATNGFVMSVCLEKFDSQWKDFHEIRVCNFYWTLWKSRFSLKSEKFTDTLQENLRTSIWPLAMSCLYISDSVICEVRAETEETSLTGLDFLQTRVPPKIVKTPHEKIHTEYKRCLNTKCNTVFGFGNVRYGCP
jgi:hypothetical protein